MVAIGRPLEARVSPEGIQLRYVMCKACDAPVTTFNLANPFDVKKSLDEHKKRTGHGADNFYPTPDIAHGKIRIRFEDAGDAVTVRVLTDLPSIKDLGHGEQPGK